MTKQKISTPSSNFCFGGMGNCSCGFHASRESDMKNRIRHMGPMNCCGLSPAFTEKEELEWLKNHKETLKDQLSRIEEEIAKVDTNED